MNGVILFRFFLLLLVLGQRLFGVGGFGAGGMVGKGCINAKK